MIKDKTIAIRVSADMLKGIEAERKRMSESAKNFGLAGNYSVSDIVRDMINCELDRREGWGIQSPERREET